MLREILIVVWFVGAIQVLASLGAHAGPECLDRERALQITVLSAAWPVVLPIAVAGALVDPVEEPEPWCEEAVR